MAIFLFYYSLFLFLLSVKTFLFVDMFGNKTELMSMLHVHFRKCFQVQNANLTFRSLLLIFSIVYPHNNKFKTNSWLSVPVIISH